LLDETPLHPQARAVFDRVRERVLAQAARIAEARGQSDAAARQIASALYHLTTATAMAWEAGRTGSPRRMRLAQWVLRQRLLPQDPLALDDEPGWLPALLEPAPGAADEAVDAIDLLSG
jgi:acyl-CoA dehydrogenase